MSALTPFIDRDACEAGLVRIRALQDAVGFNSRDSMTELDVARNLASGRPAFGWLNTYSNAPAGTFAAHVNHFGGIEQAQVELVGHFTRNGRDVRDECWLDNLLPLNKAAVMDLMRAYQNVGTFRSPEELRRRTERVENAALREVA